MSGAITLFVVLSIFLTSNAQYITGSQFKCMFPAVSQTKIDDWIPELNSALEEFDITSYNRIIMFMAQTGHETDKYNTFKEYTNRDGTNAYCRKYGGGCRYIGRGAMQLTHNYNYRSAGQGLGVGDQLVNSPELVATPAWAFRTAGWFWKEHSGLNTCASSGDVTACTRIINGGTRGLADRKALYAKAKQCISAAPVAPTPPRPVAPTPATCRVNQPSVRVRGAPCTTRPECAQVTTLSSGTIVTPTGQSQTADGFTWTQISAPRAGWIASQYLTCSNGNREENVSGSEDSATPRWVWAVVGVTAGLVLLAVMLGAALYKLRTKSSQSERF